MLSFGHGPVQSHAEDFHIHIVDGIDHDFIEIANLHQLIHDLVDVQCADIFQRNAGHIRSLIFSTGLFFDVVLDIGSRITEGLILGKFRFSGRYQFFAVLYIMDIVDGKTPTFFKEGTHHFSVDGHSGFFFHNVL